MAVATPASGDNVATLIARTEAVRTKDHPQFVQLLVQLHNQTGAMDARQRWHLRYLDTWETLYQGNSKAAEPMLRDVIAHAGDSSLEARATGLLMNDLSVQSRYMEAYVVADHATSMLASVNDPMGRFVLLANLSQMLSFAGQTDLAMTYADMMAGETPPGETPCQAQALKVTALEGGKRLNSHSAELLNAITDCTTEGQPVFANTMSLILIDRLLEESDAAAALARINSIEPGIQRTGYFPHRMAILEQRARALAQLGQPAEAKRIALQAAGMSHPGDVNDWLLQTYKVLYEITKAQGDTAAALTYHEEYVKQDQGFTHDATARAMAYEAARQQVLAQKLETARLNAENDVLRVQRELDNQTVETSRLYIALLTLALLAVVFLTVRLRRSQQRFKQLSSIDGLTGIFLQRHFLHLSETVLREMKERSAPASMLALDLDHFKTINDTYGHAVGDDALRHAVHICQQQLRPSDLFGRLGGEEFGVMLPDLRCDEAAKLAERIRRAIETTPMVSERAVVHLSISIGVACSHEHGYSLDALCRASDEALYRAKRTGRNRVAMPEGQPEVCPA